jgi:hypothetical protein
MYFNAYQVNKELLCSNCEGKLDIPKILPCGETICSLCEKSIQVNNQMFDCLVCKDKHEMPKNGFKINKSLSDILATEQTKVSRGEAYDSLKKMSNEIQKNLNLIKLGIENGTDFVKEHCMDLRSDVQLKTEEAIQQINDINSKIIEEIDEYEQKLINFNKTNSKSLDTFNKIVKELESFHTLNNEYLSKNEVDDKLIKKSNEDSTKLVKKAELEIENLKDIIFNGNVLEFERNNEKICKNLLGVTISKKMIESNILDGNYQIKELFLLCEFPIRQKWNLIYRASKDGFEATNFHSKCDNKPNTLIIIKSTNDNVFGGYTEQTWNQIGTCGHYKADPNSFIFSLINKLNKPLKIESFNNYSICCNSSYGPVFGAYDLSIANNSNTNTTSSSNLGLSYTHPDYAFESNEAKSFLAGSYKFQVSEIEVYTKQ